MNHVGRSNNCQLSIVNCQLSISEITVNCQLKKAVSVKKKQGLSALF